MDSLLERFRNAAENRKSHRYSGQLRSMAVQYAQQQLRAGRKLTAIAQELKLAFVTLKNWISKSDASFLPVQVSSDLKVDEQTGNAQERITLVSPSGYRLEGLTIESAYQLLQLLR